MATPNTTKYVNGDIVYLAGTGYQPGAQYSIVRELRDVNEYEVYPGQRKLVEAMKAGQSPDPIHGQKAKQRSVHNNYFTLPVLFIMISNHYPMTFASRWNWLIVALVLIAGFAMRHYFNSRHQGRPSPWWTWAGN